MATILVDNVVITFTADVQCADPVLLEEARLYAYEKELIAPNWANLAAVYVADMMNGEVLSLSPLPDPADYDPNVDY